MAASAAIFLFRRACLFFLNINARFSLIIEKDEILQSPIRHLVVFRSVLPTHEVLFRTCSTDFPKIVLLNNLWSSLFVLDVVCDLLFP